MTTRRGRRMVEGAHSWCWEMVVDCDGRSLAIHAWVGICCDSDCNLWKLTANKSAIACHLSDKKQATANAPFHCPLLVIYSIAIGASSFDFLTMKWCKSMAHFTPYSLIPVLLYVTVCEILEQYILQCTTKWENLKILWDAKMMSR